MINKCLMVFHLFILILNNDLIFNRNDSLLMNSSSAPIEANSFLFWCSEQKLWRKAGTWLAENAQTFRSKKFKKYSIGKLCGIFYVSK